MSGIDRVQDESLDALAQLCIAARTIIDTRDAPMMRVLVDMLLLEIGTALAEDRDLGVGTTEDDAVERTHVRSARRDRSS